MRFAALAIPLFALALSCGDRSGQGDPFGQPTANPLGGGLRLSDVQDPGNGYKDKIVDVTGVTVLAVDGYDETGDGKSRGTVYCQDFGSGGDKNKTGLNGISLYSPALVPAGLRLSPGDVVDLSGQYVEMGAIGTASFKGQFLPQLATPTTRLRFDGPPATPTVVDLDDLDDFARGRKWIGMLVTVQDVYTSTAVILDKASGRVSQKLTKKLPGSGFSSQTTITNELMPIEVGSIKNEAKIKSITGVVTYFFSLHIAPRMGADIVVDNSQ